MIDKENLRDKTRLLLVVAQALEKDPEWSLPILDSIAIELLPAFFRGERAAHSDLPGKLRAAEAVVRYRPDSVEDMVALAGLLRDAGREEDALEILDRGLRRVQPIPVELLLERAGLLERLGRPLEAVEASYAASLDSVNAGRESQAHLSRVSRAMDWSKAFQDAKKLALDWESKYFMMAESARTARISERATTARLLRERRTADRTLAKRQAEFAQRESVIRGQLVAAERHFLVRLNDLRTETGNRENSLRDMLKEDAIRAGLEAKHSRETLATILKQAANGSKELLALRSIVQSKFLTTESALGRLQEIQRNTTWNCWSELVGRAQRCFSQQKMNSSETVTPSIRVKSHFSQSSKSDVILEEIMSPAEFDMDQGQNEENRTVLNQVMFSNTQERTPSCQTLEELLGVPTNLFVSAVYQTLLGRPPDPEGASYYHNSLRIGKSKEEIISELATSDEALQFGAMVPGVGDLARKKKWRSHWLLSRLRHVFSIDGEARQFRRESFDLFVRLHTLESNFNKLGARQAKPHDDPQAVLPAKTSIVLSPTAEDILRRLT